MTLPEIAVIPWAVLAVAFLIPMIRRRL
ncbi:hypothetical protein DS6A_78 [Mycobacterium phage DS6A]|uniref:Uncharacterized protein n=1 Tax=Mycobacterium phage DS6A TaxID=45764 RepID=G8I4I8_9CAUD|nr:hypothetical protein DS6A_78 [Mycobacterium phage DS6A]AER47632.1 hypothetical protein DS6A_78 [Mycobacterium phage DS6A]